MPGHTSFYRGDSLTAERANGTRIATSTARAEAPRIPSRFLTYMGQWLS